MSDPNSAFIEARAYELWLEFSRAEEIEMVNLEAGKPAPSAWKRWEKMVSQQVKEQFIDEARSRYAR